MCAKSVQKTELSNLTKNEIVLRPKHGGGAGGGETGMEYDILSGKP